MFSEILKSLVYSLVFICLLLSCDPGKRYFRMRKSRGETMPVKNTGIDSFYVNEK